MRFTLLLTLIGAFCLSILIAVNRTPSTQDNPTSHNTVIKYDGPAEFESLHRAIRTPDDASAPQYASGFLVKEFQKARLQAQALKSSNARTKANGVLEWKERGPNNVPGRTRGIIVDPDDPEKNTFYVGSAAGGVWKTTTGGFSWTLITPNLPNLATTVLVMAPSNRNIIYMGTGEGFGNLDRVRGNGMYKSVDRGQTWIYLPTTANFSDINRAIVDPANANIVVVATNNGIYRTTDGGVSWTQVSNRSLVQDLRATPGNFTIQYASQNGIGVLKSVDAGITWQLSNNGMSISGRAEIDVSPTNVNRLVASAQGSSSGSSSDLYISDDAGATWKLIDVSFNGSVVDFLGGQGWYDNTVAFDPFNENSIYCGGVNLFRVQLTSGSSTVPTYKLEPGGTDNFMAFTSFTNATHGNFTVGSSANNISVEFRFGQGRSQKAHRFLVPEGSTSGVPDASYSYADYIDVPFEVWDITNNRQLMVSFRDQDRNGQFNLKYSNTTGAAIEQAREYVFVNNVQYNGQAPNANITVNGGHIFQQMYFFWPVLAPDKNWPSDIITSNLRFVATVTEKRNASTVTASDAYGQFDSKNRFINFGLDFHPDQHNMVMVPMSATTYKIVVANDGGIFVSNTSATPGINQGDWSMRGITYNTSQFYGADKRPGFDEYIGGTQDNGTWKSPANASADKSTNYLFNIGGDGFEVIWHNLNDKKIIGGSQGNNFRRSTNGGATWLLATSGLSGTHPFVSKLANSRDNPDVIYTLSSAGVFRSVNFGESWQLTPITEKWGGSTTLMDVEVSRANANIVWAGSGMSTSRNLHVSTDAGQSFLPAINYTDVTLGGITKLASHPTEENTAYALFSFAGKPKILRTKDLGQTWEDLSGFGTGSTSTNGFPDVAVYCLYVRPDNPSIIWAGTEIGIVESLDNGVSWVLLEEFPAVSVWDMKGQDNQVVIATHGRGIWTATLDASQQLVKLPEIIASGSTPTKKLALRIKFTDSFDNVEFYDNASLVGSINNIVPSEVVVHINNLGPGQKNIKMVGYKGTAPYHTKVFSLEHLNILSVEEKFATYFNQTLNLDLRNLQIAPMSGTNSFERSVLQSTHPYSVSSEYWVIIKHPIKINGSYPILQYEDIALVEPGADGKIFGDPGFNDYIVAEATKNGLDWVPLADGYDARLHSDWLTTYTQGSTPTKSLFRPHEVDLTSSFVATDTVLIRLRLFSNTTITGWGWALNYIVVQQQPTAVENPLTNTILQLYPNPAKDHVNLSYSLNTPSPVEISMIDITGKVVYRGKSMQREQGTHVEKITLAGFSRGSYVVSVSTKSGILRSRLQID